MYTTLSLFFVALAASAQPAAAKAPLENQAVLTIRYEGRARTYSLEELLHHKSAVILKLYDQAAYRGQVLKVIAVPITALFQGIPIAKDETIEFDTTDGFSSSLNQERLLNKNPAKAIAYLAIEDPQNPWQHLGKSLKSAGPLYLVWENPQASKVSQEEWPYQLSSFTIKESIEKRFPAILPMVDVDNHSPVRKGFQVFLKNCFACHTLNGAGNSTMGPDLNQPYSPTEYFKESYLRLLIRNPQRLRHWDKAKMSEFSQESLSDQELDSLITYLKHMASSR